MRSEAVTGRACDESQLAVVQGIVAWASMRPAGMTVCTGVLVVRPVEQLDGVGQTVGVVGLAEQRDQECDDRATDQAAAMQ